MRKDVVGVDLGQGNTAIVGFSIEEKNGKITKSPIRSLMKNVAYSDDRGIKSYFQYYGEYNSEDLNMGKQMVEDFLTSKTQWYIGEEAFAEYERRIGQGEEGAEEPRAVKCNFNRRVQDESMSAFDTFVDESETHRIDITNNNAETSLYFAELFYQVFKSNGELAFTTDVEFVVGSPPGCGKAYAEELKKCVKNGFAIAVQKYTKKNSAIKMRSACYPEPLLAGYAWFQNNNNGDGLTEGESALVIDIGAGTADFAYVERVDGKIRAMKYANDQNGERKLIQCSGTELGMHAGDSFDDALGNDLCEYAKGFVGRPFSVENATDVKEKLHDDEHSVWPAIEKIEPNIENKFHVFRKTPPISKNDSEIPPVDFDELVKKVGGNLYKEFYAVAETVEKYCGQFNVPNCSKILFVGGSSKIDSLKEIVTRRLDKCARNLGNGSLKRCDLKKLSQTQMDILDKNLELTPFTAVAIGACLVYDTETPLVVAPPLRMYVYNDGDKYEAHCLINNFSECMGPLVITSAEMEEYISDSILRVHFMEDGELVYKDGRSAFDDETVSLFDLEVPNAEQRARGVTFVDAKGNELYDTGKPWPRKQAQGGDYHEIKEEISINIRNASKADLIILPSKHGKDINRTYVYYLQKIKVVTKNDGEETPLSVYDALRDQEFSFKIESYDENGQPLSLSEDEKAFNEKAKFHKSKASHTYYYVATKIGANDCKKVILDKILSGEVVLNDGDKEEFLKILNGNWKKEDK